MLAELVWHNLTRFVELCIMSSQIVDVNIWGYYIRLLGMALVF
ncbi:hypothetical protein DF16_pBMB7921orf00005 (plasmid) [Bacillus thuringiensis serovar kurstaki str. YBT-1520]|nr:hypothetical protein DF16_pBMB7921orf00005 [Bacillus thuringiensis serovar kurstaki str. YBT-1520]